MAGLLWQGHVSFSPAGSFWSNNLGQSNLSLGARKDAGNFCVSDVLSH